MRPEAQQRVLVLLRGINVGGRHMAPMVEIRRLFAGELGCSGVATYIQSGNIVCTAPSGLTESTIARALAQRFGFAVPVAKRSLPELAAALAANPFAEGDAEPASLHTVFLAEPLSAAILETLHAKCAGEEQLAAHGRELFLSLPHGAGRSKLALAVIAPSMPGNPTMRNWKTVLQLRAMLNT